MFNTLLLDKSVDDRLRSYPTWISSRNLANEASDESVQALVDAVVGRYDIPQRWYALKAKVLGLDRLADYDRMASVADDESSIGWREAKDDRARLLRQLLARDGRHRDEVLRRAVDRRAGPAGQATRVPSAPTPSRRTTPTCC